MKTTKTKRRLSRLRTQFRRYIKLTFIPHKANHYRPHLIRRHGLVAVLVIIIAVQAVYNISTTGTVLGEKTTVTAETLLADTNGERVTYKLKPLEIDSRLEKAAELKAQDMFKQQYWAHTAPDGTSPWQWFKHVAYSYNFAGENLAKNFRSSDAVMTAWMSSPEHQSNILNSNYSQVGFAVMDGILNDKPTTLVVALYGSPAEVHATGATLGVQQANTPVGQMGIISQIGVAIQSMTPAVVGSVVLLLLTGAVALLAHAYRNKLPKKLRMSWYRHHGLIKVGGMLSLGLIIVILQTGGQI